MTVFKSTFVLANLTLALAFVPACSGQGVDHGAGTGEEERDRGSGASTSGDDDKGFIELNSGDDGGGEPTLGDPTDSCAPRAIGRLRDYQAQGDIGTCPVNQDFQNPKWRDPVPDVGWLEAGIAALKLGEDQKPVFAGGSFETVTSASTFNAWYRDDPDCNQAFEFEVPFETDPDTGHLVFETDQFFPLDGVGYGNSAADEISGKNRNFHFTFELHMTFLYSGGEVFNFRGDDDLFVFINGQLAIDLGGVHTPHEQAVNLDDLELTRGQEYPIDFFHAERSASQSNFRIETSLKFTNCEPIIVVK